MWSGATAQGGRTWSPTGPVRRLRTGPSWRIQPRPDENKDRTRTTAADGPVRNAPAVTARPTTSKVRSAVLMN